MGSSVVAAGRREERSSGTEEPSVSRERSKRTGSLQLLVCDDASVANHSCVGLPIDGSVGGVPKNNNNHNHNRNDLPFASGNNRPSASASPGGGNQSPIPKGLKKAGTESVKLSTSSKPQVTGGGTTDDATDIWTYHFLIVDDTPSNRRMLQMVLNKRNIHCDVAQDGKEAVDMVADHGDRYDFIFMVGNIANVS